MADLRGKNSNGDGLTVKTETRDSAVVVSPTGDIDLSASPILRQELRKVQGNRPQRLVINLAAVPYMDSSGVATLVEAMQMARKNNTALVLCALQDRVRSIFEIARLDTVFKIVDTIETAVTK